MLTWPHADTDWAEQLPRIESVYQALVTNIARFQRLLIVCNSAAHRQHIESLLDDKSLQHCVFAIADSNDSWCRDHGPIGVQHKGELQLLDFQFNGWGQKFPAALDNAINQACAEQHIFAAPLHRIDLVLEGGSIETDGRGSLLTTEQCLLTDTRNPQLSKTEIEQQLKQLFGVQQILWLQHGALAGDDTDSHIDTLARFCDPHTIVYCQCDEDDEHYAELHAMEQELQQLCDADGQPYRLHALPLPDPVFDAEDQRMPATYANFLIINGAVLVPVYNDRHDQQALDILAAIFKDREIIGIDCLPVIEQHGSLHCLTMQLPEGVLKSC